MARLEPFQSGSRRAPPSRPLFSGERVGVRGERQPPEQASAPHPNPLPVKYGERGLRDERVRVLASLLALLLAVVLTATAALADPKFPPLTGRIVDEAALLTGDDRRALEAELKALEEKSTDQLVVYTTRSLQGYPIEDFGYQLGRTWAIGQKDKNNGVILIVAPTDRKVRIEVGRGLEPQLTDLMTKLIIENAILPAFRRNDFAGGIKAGVRDIRDVLLGDAEEVKQRARGGAKRSPGGDSNFPLLILFLFILVAISMVWMQARQNANLSPAARAAAARRRAASSASPWSSGGFGGGSGGWSGGGSGAAAGAEAFREAAAISAAVARRAAGSLAARRRRWHT